MRLDSPNQGVVVERYDGVTFEDLTGSTKASAAFFVIYAMTNLTVDGFDVAGTPYAFLADNRNGPISGSAPSAKGSTASRIRFAGPQLGRRPGGGQGDPGERKPHCRRPTVGATVRLPDRASRARGRARLNRRP